MSDTYAKAKEIWKSREFPVIFKPDEGPVLVRFIADEMIWPLKLVGKQRFPKLSIVHKRWIAPRTHFDHIISEAIKKFGCIYVIQYFSVQKRCAKKCREAKGFDCECTCGGEFHGIDGPLGKWVDISDTFSITIGTKFLSCRMVSTLI